MITSSRSDKEIEAEATQILKKHGFRADGTPLNDERVREVRFATLSPARLDTLREVGLIGGSSVHKCIYGNREVDPAAEFGDNELTLITHLLEESD